jgi:hypothetical protein
MSSFIIYLSLIILFLLIILILYIFIVSKICNGSESPEVYEYQANNFQKSKDPTILMIGGTHGNEPAGYYSLKKLICKLNLNEIKIKKGRLIIIPAVNYCALKLNLRFIPLIGDLNRKYPTKINEKINNPIIKKITNLIQESNFILDLHEGFDFNGRNILSMGSTLTHGDTEESLQLSQKIVEEVNKNISIEYKKFRIYTSRKDLLNNNNLYRKRKNIKGSLSYYTNNLHKDYILVETTGQNNIEPLSHRVKIDMIIINFIMKYYEII